MAAKGATAKLEVVKRLKESFGNDFIGESGGKYYLWAKDGAEKVQIAVSLTCPKNPIGTVDMSSAFGDGLDFEAEPVLVKTSNEPVEVTDDEKQTLAEMMARLGL